MISNAIQNFAGGLVLIPFAFCSKASVRSCLPAAFWHRCFYLTCLLDRELSAVAALAANGDDGGSASSFPDGRRSGGFAWLLPRRARRARPMSRHCAGGARIYLVRDSVSGVLSLPEPQEGRS